MISIVVVFRNKRVKIRRREFACIKTEGKMIGSEVINFPCGNYF